MAPSMSTLTKSGTFLRVGPFLVFFPPLSQRLTSPKKPDNAYKTLRFGNHEPNTQIYFHSAGYDTLGKYLSLGAGYDTLGKYLSLGAG
jgi:hypothetical protein